jgi:hypothetical protein
VVRVKVLAGEMVDLAGKVYSASTWQDRIRRAGHEKMRRETNECMMLMFVLQIDDDASI